MLRKTSDQDKQERVELQRDVKNLNTALCKAIQEKISKHLKMNEMIRINEELSSEIALHNSTKRMKVSDGNERASYRT